jgi:hypothetical protein
MVQEARADHRPEGCWAHLGGAADQVDGADAVLAVRAQVVADDEAAVGPAHEHGPVEAQLLDDGGHVVGPERAVGVVLGLQRRLGHAVAAQVVGHQPELLGQSAVVLLGPAEVALRDAVDEQDRRSVRRAPLAHVQPQAAAALHRVDLCRPGRLLVARRGLCDRCHLLPPWRSWFDGMVAVEEPGAHREESLILRRQPTYPPVDWARPRPRGSGRRRGRGQDNRFATD